MATDTTTTIAEPWSGIQPYLKNLYSRANTQYGKPLKYYSGSTVADLSSQTQGALGGLYNFGMNQTPYGAAGQDMLTQTLQGGYLNSNPYLDATYDRAADAVSRQFSQAVLPGIGTQFSQAGRLGSGAHENAADWAMDSLGRQLTGLATDIYGGNYAQERQNQMGAAGMVPGMQQAEAQRMGAALGAGQIYDAQAQAQLTDKVNRFNFQQMEPWQRLQMYQGAITGGGASGGTQTTTAPAQSNLPMYLGAGLTGGGLIGSAMGWW